MVRSILMNSILVTDRISTSLQLALPLLGQFILPRMTPPNIYIYNSPANSFYLSVLSAVTEEYVAQLFSNLNERKALLDIPIEQVNKPC